MGHLFKQYSTHNHRCNGYVWGERVSQPYALVVRQGVQRVAYGLMGGMATLSGMSRSFKTCGSVLCRLYQIVSMSLPAGVGEQLIAPHIAILTLALFEITKFSTNF